MVDKPESVLDKLDSQGKKIEDISEKLDGVSVNDLYSLAKRTWDYGDYQTAQKYYNHISLLRPLDWEAPLYASLCNFKGYHDMFFWTKVPKQLQPIIVSTIKYINNLDLDKEKKESEMSRCVDIIKTFMKGTNDHYFKYSNEYNDTNINYIFELQEWFVNILEQIKDIELNAIKSFCSFLADCCLNDVKTAKRLASDISLEKFDYLKTIASKDWEINDEEIIKKREELSNQLAKHKKELTLEEKKNIILHSKIYFEYNDKVIARRVMRRRFILGLIITIFSIVGTIFSFFVIPFTSFMFIISTITGVVIVFKAFLEKDRMFCTSILACRREKRRLTSNNTVVRESVVSVLVIYLIISLVVQFVVGLLASIAAFESLKDVELAYKIIYLVCFVIVCIVQYIYLLDNMKERFYSGHYKYLYNGHFYSFE